MAFPIGAKKEEVKKYANEIIKFVNESPSPYHVVNNAKTKLINAGFKQLDEKKVWNLEKGGKYFLTRNESCLIAFVVGKKFKSGNGITLIGTHTDSPCLRLKPNSKKFKSDFLSVGVQLYGGGLWQTWFDRDLTVAGRVMIKNKDGGLEHQLVNLKDPIMRIPNLCIHLRGYSSTCYEYNTETNLVPIIATKIFEDELNKSNELDEEEAAPIHYQRSEEIQNESEETQVEENSETDNEAKKHHTILIKLICENIGCKPEDLVNMELCLADTQPACIGGAYKEFIFSPRLDNSFNTFCAVTALAESASDGIDEETNIRMINCFDNEEIGSGSAQGAESKFPELVMRRICQHFGGAFEQTISNSFLLSADQAFGVNPNYPEKYEDNHRPNLHRGLMMDTSANQSFATTAITGGIIRTIAKECRIEIQDYVIRNDSSGGTTIGPIQAMRLGMQTVDISGPILSMHSIRETCGITSVEKMVSLFKGLYKLYPSVNAGIKL